MKKKKQVRGFSLTNEAYEMLGEIVQEIGINRSTWIELKIRQTMELWKNEQLPPTEQKPMIEGNLEQR